MVAYEQYLDRARALMKDAYVFDFAPLGEPVVMTDRHQAIMTNALARGLPLPAVIRGMLQDRLAELEEDAAARDRVAAVWARSGVRGVQVTLAAQGMSLDDWDGLVRDLAFWARRSAIGDMAICTSADALEETARTGRIGVLYGLQDAAPVGRDLERLETLYNFGVRVIQLTYNLRNAVGDGCTERAPAGLSRFGVEFVRRCNELGIIVDTSHCGAPTADQAFEVSNRPVAVTHACCMAVAPHARAKTDDQLRRVRDGDGYFGVVTVPFFLKPDGDATLDDFLRHLEHAANIVGPQRVGIATDWGAWTPDVPAELVGAMRAAFREMGFRDEDMPALGVSLPEFSRWEEWPNLVAGLCARGYSDEDIRGLVGGNWLRFMRRATQ